MISDSTDESIPIDHFPIIHHHKEEEEEEETSLSSPMEDDQPWGWSLLY